MSRRIDALNGIRIGMFIQTAAIQEWIGQDAERLLFVTNCFKAHLTGLWGEVDDEDEATNEACLLEKGRLMSVWYLPTEDRAERDDRIWVITDQGHEVTTVLFPSDY